MEFKRFAVYKGNIVYFILIEDKKVLQRSISKGWKIKEVHND